MSSVFSGDKTAPLIGILGAATAVFSCIGNAFRTAKSGVGSMGVMLPEQVMKSIVPVVMAGAIYGLINAYIISTGTNCFFDGYANLSSGLALAGLSAIVIGMVGNTGVRTCVAIAGDHYWVIAAGIRMSTVYNVIPKINQLFGFQSATTQTAEDALIGKDDRSVFTLLEKELCGDCLSILASPDPIPDDAKPYLDQVVETKGYGVTLHCPPCLRCKVGQFVNASILRGRAEYPTTLKYVDRVIGEVLLIEMKKKTGKNYRSLGVERLVRKTGFNYTFLVTIGVVEEENDDDEDGSSTSVEFIISTSGQGSLENPVLGQHFQLREWKLKRGSMVICCGLDYPLTVVLYTIGSGFMGQPCEDALKIPGFTSLLLN